MNEGDNSKVSRVYPFLTKQKKRKKLVFHLSDSLLGEEFIYL